MASKNEYLEITICKEETFWKFSFPGT